MSARRRTTAICAAVMTAAAAAVGGVSPDPLSLLTAVGTIEMEDRSRIDAGGAVFTVLPARGRDLAVVGITRTGAGGGSLAAWTREIERLYRGRYMPAITRFSDPPQLEDLATLVLDDEDLNDLRKCRPGDCGVKLSAGEIEDIRQAGAAAGAQWKPAMQLAFRDAVLARAQAYLQGGLAVAPAYDDRKTPVSPALEFAEIASRLGFEPLYGAQVLSYLHHYPAPTGAGVESFLYWSKETLGSGKPIVSITHVAIIRSLHAGAPATIVAARQVYATHYLTGSLSLTLIAGGEPHYLVYLRRSRTDAFGGTFGKLIRRVVEHRIRAEAPPVLDALRRKLESGHPPGADATR